MKPIGINFEVQNASLQTYQGLAKGGEEWLSLRLRPVDAKSIFDDAGAQLDLYYWWLRVEPMANSTPLADQGSIGSISYLHEHGGVCRGDVLIAVAKFERLVQVLLSGRMLTQVMIEVEGFTENGSGLVWRRPANVALPITMACVTTDLSEITQRG